MVKRLVPRSRRGEDSEAIDRALLTAVIYLRDESDRALVRPLLDGLQQAWKRRRDELLPAFIAENPGTRPWAWWAFDAESRCEWPLHI